MLYTTYLAKIDKIPKDAIKLIIMRYPPRDFNILKYNKVYMVPALAPSANLLKEYNATEKKITDWIEYTKKFIKEMDQRIDMKDALNKVARLVNGGVDVYLICYEKNGDRCHRSILARGLESTYKISWKEF